MGYWKIGAAVVCTCIFLIGETGDVVRLAYGPCGIHDLCRVEPEPSPHVTDTNTFVLASSSS